MVGTVAPPPLPPSVDPRSGYCSETKTYYSLRPPISPPPEALPLSVTTYALSLLPSPLPSNPALVDTAIGASVSFSDFVSQIRDLAASLRSQLGLAKGQVAFVLSPTRIDVPVLYLALLYIGVVVSPANPVSTPDEISRQFQLTHPAIAFATSASAHKLPPGVPTVILDSSRFRSLISRPPAVAPAEEEIRQFDVAAILYSSGTTGLMKGVVLSHRNFVAHVAGYHASRVERDSPSVTLFTLPLFHVAGFFMLIRAVALGETTALMGRFELKAMLRAIEAHRVTFMPVSPPLVVAMVKSEEAARHDLSSLEVVSCGGAPLGRELAERFVARFPHVRIVQVSARCAASIVLLAKMARLGIKFNGTQGYGLTESTGSGAISVADEPVVLGSVGRLTPTIEARIVVPGSAECLPPGQQGELWLRGPTIMKGYIGDDEATASTLDSEGWLKTGDLCYFDHDGLLFIVDRLKELIKYKAYQVPPAELEHILHSHPEIADAAVIPYPDEAAGQIPMAFVVRQPGSTLNEEQVMDFVAKQVAPYKRIRKVAFVSSIPKSAAGKIMRRELVDHALSSPTSKL